MAGGRSCKAKLKNGDPCRSIASVGEYCAGHYRKLAEAKALEAPEAPVAEPVEAEPETVDEPAAPQRKRRGRVANVREALREDASEAYDRIVDLLEQAMDAERDQYATCPNCSKRHPVKVADWGARTKAVELLLNQGYGRPSDSGKAEGPASLTEAGLPLEELSMAELNAYLLVHYVQHPEELEKQRRELEVVSAALEAGLPVEDAALVAAVETGLKLHRIAAALGIVDAPEDRHGEDGATSISAADKTEWPRLVRERHRSTVMRYRDLMAAHQK